MNERMPDQIYLVNRVVESNKEDSRGTMVQTTLCLRKESKTILQVEESGNLTVI